MAHTAQEAGELGSDLRAQLYLTPGGQLLAAWTRPPP